MTGARPAGYVLAGGRSRRFGTEKARAVVEGLPLVARIARRLVGRVASVTVVADRAGKFADLGLRTIADPIEAQGPIGGLLGALQDAGCGPVFVVSCDWVSFEPRWFDRLRAAMRPGDAAVAFRGRRWEPTLALWDAALAPEVRRAIGRGERALFRLLDRIGARALPLPPDWQRVAVQVNTRRALARWKAGRLHG